VVVAVAATVNAMNGSKLVRNCSGIGVRPDVTHRRIESGQQAIPHPEAVGAELFGRRREAGKLSDIQVGGVSELRQRESQHDRQASSPVETQDRLAERRGR